MMAAGGRGSGAANIRVRPFCAAHRVDDGWRDFLSHPQRHPEHRHAGLAVAGPADLAACLSTCGICRRPRRCPRTRRRPAERLRRAGALRRIRLSCKTCHPAIYDALEEDADGQRRARPARASGRHHSGPLQARPARPLFQGRRRASSTAASGSSATSRRSATTISRSPRSGTSPTRSGGPTSSRTAPTGGPRFIRPTTSSARPARSATAATRSTTTSRPRPSPNGTSAASAATGPGASTSSSPTRENIVNPARLDYVHANDTCIQCHSQGRPLNNPIDGKYYDWPVGFHVGLNLADYWQLEEHKLGETTFTHFPDGTAHKNRMQGNDFVQSLMYTRGVTCFSCHDVHGTENAAQLREPRQRDLPRRATGRTRRTGRTPPPSRSTRITRRAARAASASPATCRRSRQTIADVNVRAHTFRFITPAETDAYKIPNACNICHTDKSTEWAGAGSKILAGSLALADGQLRSAAVEHGKVNAVRDHANPGRCHANFKLTHCPCHLFINLTVP